MELTSENVSCVYEDCSGDPGDLFVEGISRGHNFRADRIDHWNDDIFDMLKQLPAPFRSDSGGGWTFLNGCLRSDGKQWTDLHFVVELLMCLGIASGRAEFLFTDRELWLPLPGRFPYFLVDVGCEGDGP